MESLVLRLALCAGVAEVSVGIGASIGRDYTNADLQNIFGKRATEFFKDVSDKELSAAEIAKKYPDIVKKLQERDNYARDERLSNNSSPKASSSVSGAQEIGINRSPASEGAQ